MNMRYATFKSLREQIDITAVQIELCKYELLKLSHNTIMESLRIERSLRKEAEKIYEQKRGKDLHSRSGS